MGEKTLKRKGEIVNIRYQADADSNQAILTGFLRREPTVDFQKAFAAKLEGYPFNAS